LRSTSRRNGGQIVPLPEDPYRRPCSREEDQIRSSLHPFKRERSGKKTSAQPDFLVKGKKREGKRKTPTLVSLGKSGLMLRRELPQRCRKSRAKERKKGRRDRSSPGKEGKRGKRKGLRMIRTQGPHHWFCAGHRKRGKERTPHAGVILYTRGERKRGKREISPVPPG